MKEATVAVSEEQLAKLIEAYKTIQEFLTSTLSPEKIYGEEFLESLHESENEVQKKNMTQLRSFDDFIG